MRVKGKCKMKRRKREWHLKKETERQEYTQPLHKTSLLRKRWVDIQLGPQGGGEAEEGEAGGGEKRTIEKAKDKQREPRRKQAWARDPAEERS